MLKADRVSFLFLLPKKHYILFFGLVLFGQKRGTHIHFIFFSTKNGRKRTKNKADTQWVSSSDNFSTVGCFVNGMFGRPVN